MNKMISTDTETETFRRERSQWFYTDKAVGEGVVLLVHGLNQKPSSWSELTAHLNSLNLHVYRLALKGHRGLGFGDMKAVNARIWEEELVEAREEIQQQFAALPVYLVAFSLGSLVAMAVQLKKGRNLFDRQVLLAPALAIRPYTRLAVPLCALFRYLPSRSPRRYVANREGTTSEAYRALFQLEREVNAFRDLSALNIPTQVMMRPDDELISYKATVKFVRNNRLDAWQVTPLVEEPCGGQCSLKYRHLIVDQQSAGSDVWRKVTEEMGRFLSGDGRLC